MSLKRDASSYVSISDVEKEQQRGYDSALEINRRVRDTGEVGVGVVEKTGMEREKA